ncbi:MAG TPA: class I SAM-dependent methyltransferase [Gemmatales bacterium]|nr:class I SAM-dependent methyltransferase [Gemmatales bacterium]HMP59264.1 class I SAM-dependent methyltransferase [Gemmatales bacterium]
MTTVQDLRALYHLAFAPIRGRTHAERLESFYQKQARHYDDSRARLLQGRAELYAALPVPQDGVWIEFGGGTGANLERLGESLRRLRRVYVVDLSPSLLAVAQQRIRDRGWTNVVTVEADATTFSPPEGQADVVTFSYSLTMIPHWFAAVDQAERLLRPGGHVGVVDFYVSKKHPMDGWNRHGWWTRTFWPTWFSFDNVHPSPDHIPYLHHRFAAVRFTEARARLPWLPLARTPYYWFVGQQRGGS